MSWWAVSLAVSSSTGEGAAGDLGCPDFMGRLWTLPCGSLPDKLVTGGLEALWSLLGSPARCTNRQCQAFLLAPVPVYIIMSEQSGPSASSLLTQVRRNSCCCHPEGCGWAHGNGSAGGRAGSCSEKLCPRHRHSCRPAGWRGLVLGTKLTTTAKGPHRDQGDWQTDLCPWHW